MTLYATSKPFHKNKQCQGTVIVSTLIILSIGIFGLVYIVQANGVVGQGYEIRDLEEKKQELQVNNQKLQIEAARLQFPANLEEIAQRLNMVEVEQVIYLEQSTDVAVGY